MNEREQKPEGKVKQEGKVKLPNWVLPALATAAISVIGAALTVWNNSSVHSNQISVNVRMIDRLEKRVDELSNETQHLQVKLARLDREQNEFSAEALDKLNEILVRSHGKHR